LSALWPYILPLPVERKEFNRVFQAVFGSKAALEVLKRSSPNRRVYQKELISELGFSNKTVIEALKKLVSAGVLEQGMERRREKGKTVWEKWYIPTFQGKWLTLLLRAPESLPRSEAREIVTELFMMYMEHIIKLCEDYNIEPRIFESTMNKAFLKMMEGTKLKATYKSRVIVYGSAAVDTIAVADKLPKADETLYISDVQDYPGGSAANVAVALRRLGVTVSFIGKIGGDAEGVLLMKEFQKEDVDMSGAVIEPGQRTVKTFISIDKYGGKRIYVLGGDNVALSISSPKEVDWNKIEESEIVYIGEVFIEIAELIASFAKSSGKRVIYRPGLPIIAFNPEKVRNVLRNVDVLILNKQGWEAIKKSSNSTPAELTKLGPEIVIMTKGAEGCEAYTKDESFAIPAYTVEAVDTTGAGDAFAAGLINALLESNGLRECVEYALAVSAISVTKKGARTALPTRSEVEEFMKHRKAIS